MRSVHVYMFESLYVYVNMYEILCLFKSNLNSHVQFEPLEGSSGADPPPLLCILCADLIDPRFSVCSYNTEQIDAPLKTARSFPTTESGTTNIYKRFKCRSLNSEQALMR